MSIIIRLQNLPWSANSLDIRRFFSGLSIPEGGVHIVGGEMGDAFIAFSTDEDARLAMEKDGGKIKDMQIKLLLSSRTEMMRVIEQARQQNMVVTQPHIIPQPPILSLQQPARIMTPTPEPERRRGRSPSPPRRSRDRSPVRDRRRSPDDRRTSKRDRSRSPSRSSRSFSRDMDRRSDRFKRDDRRYDDSRYRDDRRTERETAQESKRYPDADHVNSKSQLHATEGFRNMTSSTSYEQVNTVASVLYPYGNQQAAVKGFQEPYAHTSANLPSHLPQAEQITSLKPQNFQPVVDQKYPLSSTYTHDPSYASESSMKDSSVSSAEQSMAKHRRRTRFEPDSIPASVSSHFSADDTKLSVQNQQEMPYDEVRNLPENFSGNYTVRNTWPHEANNRITNKAWNGKQENMLNPPTSKNADFLQAVPMDVDQSPSNISAGKETYHETLPHRGPQVPILNDVLPRNDDLRRDNRGLPIPVDKGHPTQDRGFMHDENRKAPMKDRETVPHNDKRGLSLQDRGPLLHGGNRTLLHQERGPLPHGENRTVPMQDRGPMSHGDNRTRLMQDRGSMPHGENRMHLMQEREPLIRDENRPFLMQDRGPMSRVENREPPMQDKRQMSRVENREPPMHDRGPMPHVENREPPMHDRGPISRVENRERPMHDRGPMPRVENREPPVHDRGSMSRVENREPPMHDRGPMPRVENREPPVHDRGPMPRIENREPLMHDRGPMSRVENREPSMPDRGPVSRVENREPSMPDRGPMSRVENREPSMPDRGPMSRVENREPSMPDRGPMSRVENREPPMPDRGPMSRVENREPPMHDRGSMSRVENREHPMHDRGQMTHGESRTHPMQDRGQMPRNENNKSLSMQDRGSRLHNENRGSPAQERGPISHSDSRGQPLHNDSPGRLPPSLTVEVRGLPPDARIEDILDLFHGISLPAANIRIEANDLGLEKAFIRFVSVADFDEALRRNRQFIHEGRCELIPCPAAAFDSAPRSQKSRPKLKPRDEDLIVQLRGLPFSCKEDDIVSFFDGLGILDLFIEIGPDGRALGTGFVEFGTPEDFRAALAMNGKMIGPRYITISIASKEMMAFARGDDFNPELSGPRPVPRFSNGGRPPNPPVNQARPLPSHIRPPAPPVNQGRQGTPPVQARPPPCVSMKGLPEDVTNRDIVDFLGQVNVMPRAVHIMLRPDKTPSGDAFAEFVSSDDLEAALQLDGNLIRGNCVTLQPISFHEMSEVLGRPSLMPPPPAPTALLKTPSDAERPRRPPPVDVERPRRPNHGDAERPRRPLLPQGPNEGAFRERPRMEPPGRPFGGPGRMRAPWPSRPYSGGSRPEGRFPPPTTERGLQDFGAPGCVVSINNLHFRAGLEELLDFFCDYRITKDSIRRKYNDKGLTTGEARIAFPSPRDAQRAVRELNQKSIMGRPLSLSVL